ncbi:recombinase family protein [Lactococcus insecticola]|uniref:Integrase n=1 Tax=Pseudolactococcus insecticola TaxID=2709158 RepID=A0A6A0B7Q5_9LACT|nr:recombinase family protein [Lactococcus insecticola]GFH39817.1 integrase [Lactococcus insecticola]
MKKVAIYCRVSTMEQAEHGYSIGEQIDKLKKYCEIHDYTIYHEYVDAGFSGAKLDRPNMQQLISDAKKHRFEAVIVYKLDRLSRNLQNALYLIKDVFKSNDISFVSMSENIDLSTASGELNFNMFASFAEFERANIRDRMAMGAYARAKAGKCAGPSRTPFGYDYDDGILRINPVTGPIVKEIFDMYLDGLSLAKILIRLNDGGFVGKVRPWRLSTIYTIIRTKTYAGFIKYHDEYFKGLHQPIISSDDFDEVQRQIKIRQDEAYKKTNSTRPFQSKYMLSGLLRCGKCGQRLTIIQYGKTDKKDKTYKNKKYQCVGKQGSYKKRTGRILNPERCESPNYDLFDLEDEILTTLEKLKLDKLKINEEPSQNDLIVSRAETEIKDTEEKLKKIVDLYLNDNIDISIYSQKKNEYDLKLANLQATLKETKHTEKPLKKDEAIKMLTDLSDIRKISYEKQADLVKQLINKIVVNPDELSVFWNF